MPRIFHRFAILILSVTCLSACACTTPAPKVPADTSVHVSEVPRVDAEHLTLRGDVLKVTIYGEDDLSGDYIVAHDGTIALPLVGPVSVDGQPLSSLPETIANAYRKGYLVDPKVSVEVQGQVR